MKAHIGLFVLVVLLVAASGCTSQPATVNETVTTPATPVSPTEVATTVSTPLPATFATSLPTTAAAQITSVAPAATTPVKKTTASVAVTVIHIRNNTFVPAELTVLPGTGITWINDDSVVHVVKATGNASGKFTSAELITGAQFMYTFGDTTGTYEFGDPKYPGMTGRIIVQKGETLWVATFASRTT